MARLESASLGMLRFQCDECGRITEVPRPVDRWTSDDRAVEQAGWTVRHVDGAWEHYCRDCVTTTA